MSTEDTTTNPYSLRIIRRQSLPEGCAEYSVERDGVEVGVVWSEMVEGEQRWRHALAPRLTYRNRKVAVGSLLYAHDTRDTTSQWWSPSDMLREAMALLADEPGREWSEEDLHRLRSLREAYGRHQTTRQQWGLPVHQRYALRLTPEEG